MSEICGIDEAGRGCLAGSLFVCGVKCESGVLGQIPHLNDSKKLSFKRRENIYQMALEMQIPHFVVKFSASEIDELGLSVCLKNALESIRSALPFNENLVNKSSCENLANKNLGGKYIFDGNTNFGVSGIETLIGGDRLVPQISLASIIAKVHKDRESLALHAQFPQYNLAKNKGYGTKEHLEAIKKHGHSKIHRFSFKIKKLG